MTVKCGFKLLILAALHYYYDMRQDFKLGHLVVTYLLILVVNKNLTTGDLQCKTIGYNTAPNIAGADTGILQMAPLSKCIK